MEDLTQKTRELSIEKRQTAEELKRANRQRSRSPPKETPVKGLGKGEHLGQRMKKIIHTGE